MLWNWKIFVNRHRELSKYLLDHTTTICRPIRVCKNGYFFWISKSLWRQKLSLGSLLTKKIFFWKMFKTRRLLWGRNFAPPIAKKLTFLKIFKIIVESLLIAHLIGNFILKNINTGHVLIKLISDEICRHMWFYDVIYEYDVIFPHMSVLS